MSSRRLVPFLVAGVTGVLSGVYIFKPLLEKADQDRQRQAQAETGARPSALSSTMTPQTTEAADVVRSPSSQK
ncbi:hypothetical protein QCA50_010177 [Cerrena zonata]|uniref:Uncharacterized protein n=1 Tax=Cerrena zonata TaxID=2478898 RepID=A0AAW0G9K6_9APHY